MKWIVFLSLCVVALNAHAVSSSKQQPSAQSTSSESTFIQEIKLALKQRNLDSLEQVFAGFTQDKLDKNHLAEGHAVFNQIIADKSFSDTLKILAYKNKAVLYGQIDLTKKRDAFKSAIRLIRAKKCLTQLLPPYQLEVAKTYLSQSRFLDATNTLNKIEFDRVKNPEIQVELMGVSGLLYMQMDDTVKALNQFNRALKIAKEHNDYFGLGTIHSSIGHLKYSVSKQFDEAIAHFRASIVAFNKADYPHYALGSQTDMGVVYAKIEDYKSAFYYLEKSYNEAKAIGSDYDQAICAKELGILYNKLNQPEKALNYCKEAKDLNWDYGSHTFRASCASCLASAYENLNDFESSVYFLKLNQAYSDSINNKTQVNSLAKFNAELEKQSFVAEQEKVNLEKDQTLRTRNLLITFLSILSVLIIAVFLLVLRGVKNRKKREVVELKEKNQREFVKNLLQSLEGERKRVSMELHDSVGQMLVVAGRNASNKQFDNVEPMLQNALNEVRSISQGLHPYVLEKMGLQDAILNLIHTVDDSHELFIESEVDLSQSKLTQDQEIHVYRIVQELISNSLKHADSPSLLIEVMSDEDHMKIVVSDRGKGFDVMKLQEKKTMSLGMKTLHERVEIVGGTIDFDSKPNRGTTVTIEIPFNQ
jgi:signal transduction histidine kinase